MSLRVDVRRDVAAKRWAKEALRRFGIATSSLRPFPDFLIIGGKRCASTSLTQYVLDHPGVPALFPRAMKIKGVHYFDSNYLRGPAWYRSHFPTSTELGSLRRHLEYRPRVGEASPYYLFHPLAAVRAAELVPSAKIVVVLRNPVDRAYSHYRERVRNGGETLTFEEAIDAEPERLEGELDRILNDPAYRSYAHEQQSYMSQGRYLEPLLRWVEVFPREQVLLLLTDDLDRDTQGTYERLLAFLGLPPHRLSSPERWNLHPGSVMDPDTRQRLVKVFAPDNLELARAFGLDLFSWDA